ncbi:ATP-binding cassette domain-containing protein [Eggerthella sinensis]|uniref:ATP-binding cassette domain-containing protein n=1 Tax=Eggerthella sinensis TaxID=242230 RepID=UPI00266D8D3A|nr:ATP-binding cassette domain-containing protein [Eggerthella sinensis]
MVGENGAGKSTLCRAVCGILRGASGSVAFGDELLSRRRRVRRSFFVQQDADYQLYAANVADEFMVGRRASVEHRSRAAAALADVGLAGLEERHPLSLSGGQKQRLLLALAAVSDREVLVFDEPPPSAGACEREPSVLTRKTSDRGIGSADRSIACRDDVLR